MMSMVIIGAGGFGREVYELVMALGEAGESWDVEGFVDDSPDPRTVKLVRGLGARSSATSPRWLAAGPPSMP